MHFAPVVKQTWHNDLGNTGLCADVWLLPTAS
jgi:hypothetical protein